MDNQQESASLNRETNLQRLFRKEVGSSDPKCEAS